MCPWDTDAPAVNNYLDLFSTIFFAVLKSGGPTTLPNSLNISRNALFLNIRAVSEKIFKHFFP